MSDILTVTSPYDRHFIQEYRLAGAQEAEMALQRAHGLFRDPSRHLAKYRRIEILEKLAVLMAGQVEQLTLIAAEEGGKPYKDSRIEVIRAINGVKLAIASIYQMRGEEIPMGLTAASLNRLAFTTPEPVGVVLAISAFNHPLNLIVHQVIPAIAAGCPVIVKPASSTPVSCFNLTRLLMEAGLPEDWCTAIVCSREQAGRLAADPRVSYLSFIGSHEVGWKLRHTVAPGTRIALEHGGVAPVIIDETADFNEVVPLIARGGFYHAGQVCVSVQKVFVHESRAREFAIALAEEGSRMQTGDPLNPATDVGPMISTNEAGRVVRWVQEAVEEGAEAIGESIRSYAGPDTGQLLRPVVLYAPDDHSKVSREEVFGPVICVYPYAQLQQAIASANSLRYAFQASIFTKKIDTALDAAGKLNASAVMINDHTAFRVDWMPFGGRDESGIGTGGIPYSIKEMTREKLIIFHQS